ncbi:hypothetical protein [Armatimonas sp.]|uniref:hypothetical protein n=1 Tax=Armatimonas sp. TaxID=1872638 RepID=UPI003751AAE1
MSSRHAIGFIVGTALSGFLYGTIGNWIWIRTTAVLLPLDPWAYGFFSGLFFGVAAVAIVLLWWGSAVAVVTLRRLRQQRSGDIDVHVNGEKL